VAPTEQAPKQRSFHGTLPPSRKLRPGDKICGDCGEGNNANRRFCSRCGASLDEAAVVRTKWWRKLLHAAGTESSRPACGPVAEVPEAAVAVVSAGSSGRSSGR